MRSRASRRSRSDEAYTGEHATSCPSVARPPPSYRMEFARKFATNAERVLDVDSVSSVIAKTQQTKAASMSPPLSKHASLPCNRHGAFAAAAAAGWQRSQRCCTPADDRCCRLS